MTTRSPSPCPSCGLYMSFREEDEQGMCNECLGFVAGYNDEYNSLGAYEHDLYDWGDTGD